MPARSVQKPYTVTLTRLASIQFVFYGSNAADVRNQLADIETEELQQMGDIVSDICRVVRVQPA